MCEIFLQYSVQGESIDKSRFRQLLQRAEDASFKNDDGWGVFDETGSTYKVPTEFDEDDIEVVFEMFKDSQFVVLHLRMATTGSVCEKNTHPFVYEHDNGDKEILVHNGVIRNNWNDVDKKEDETDSSHLLRAIAEGDGENTAERIENAMDNVTGSSSVFFLDREGHLFYFRKGSRFAMVYDKNAGDLFGATRKNRIERMFTKKELNFFESGEEGVTKIEKPDTRTIYRITTEGIYEVGSWSASSNYGYSGKYSKDEEDEPTEDEEFEDAMCDVPGLDILFNEEEYDKEKREDPLYEEPESVEDIEGEVWYDEGEGVWRDVYGNAIPRTGVAEHFDDMEYHEAMQEVTIR